MERRIPAHFEERLCKVADPTDYENEDWLAILYELGHQSQPVKRYRKYWEWVQGIYGLKQLGFLRDNVHALGIGAGKESVLYYLANHVGHVLGTDMYDGTSWNGPEAPKEMLEHPESFAPFPYRKDRLSIRYMDGRNLDLDDNSFDVVFSFSAIEHFGGHAAATSAMREMGRVVRPAGVVVVATELILNGLAPPESFLPALTAFLPEEIQSELIEPSGLQLVEDIDFSISDEMLAMPVAKLDSVDWHSPQSVQSIPPHFIVGLGKWFWTSVLFLLTKP